MIANAVFVATLIFLALGVWLSSELRFLTPWRSLLGHHYFGVMATYCALLFANILGAAIWIERKFFLRDTGRKLKHLDQEIHSGHTNSQKKSPRNSTKNERSNPAMEQEIPRRIPVDDVDREQYLDRSFDLVARVRAAREAAQREMEAFGDVSEYEIRKIYGQRTDIRYDDPEKKAEEPTPALHEERPDISEERHSGDASNDDHRQSTFDFTADDTANHPQPEEE